MLTAGRMVFATHLLVYFMRPCQVDLLTAVAVLVTGVGTSQDGSLAIWDA